MSTSGHRFAAGLMSALISGALLGFACPLAVSSFLAPLAWVSFLPLLLWLGPSAGARRILAFGGIAAFTAYAVGPGWGMVIALKWFALVYYAVAGLVMTVPWVGFAIFRKLLGWRTALWTMPLLWPLSEWACGHWQLVPPWLGLASTQPDFVWLFQFADLFGGWGVSCWVMLFNVLLYRAVVGQSTGRIRRVAAVGLAMLAPIAAYSAYRIAGEEARERTAPDTQRIKVMMAQPNASPDARPDQRLAVNVIEGIVDSTDRAMAEFARAGDKPDLIVWPEGAIPVAVLTGPTSQLRSFLAGRSRRAHGDTDVDVRNFLAGAVADWGTPVLLGAFDAPRAPGASRNRLLSNAAMLLTPGPPGSGADQVRMLAPYHKRRLVPFIEYAPYADRFPWLRRIEYRLGAGGSFQPGRESKVFSYLDDLGQTVQLAPAICYEELYAADFAENARGGAELFAILSNDAWFGRSQALRGIADLTRWRAIETRRPVARSTNTGRTVFLDTTGRPISALPEWQSGTLTATLVRNSGLTFYVRHPDLFPLMCAIILAVIGGAGFGLRNRIKQF